MTYVLVDVHHRTHTCPSNPEPHPYDTVRTVIGLVPGGPCRQPVTIRCGDLITTLPCGRHTPADHQCPPCRVTVTERHVTNELTGHDTRERARVQQPVRAGLASHPCRICGNPLAAVLSDQGRHLLCEPRRPPQQSAGRNAA